MKKEDYLNSVNLNAETDFPYLVMEIINDQSYPRNPGFHVMHWHEDLQFICVLEGDIILKTLQDEHPVHAGEAVFINKNIVHMVEHDKPCHYYSFVFPDYFLRFYFDSPAARLTDRITGSGLPYYIFLPENAWCIKLIKRLKKLISLEKKQTEYYPYEVLTRLSSIWLLFMKNLSLEARERPDALNGRMQAFLRYIEGHYEEDISLHLLAASANVSISECTRCFKKCLRTTPYRYLIEYRLSKAAALLEKTDLPVSTIAMDVGFRQLSHFGKCFKEKTGLAPRDYRKAKAGLKKTADH